MILTFDLPFAMSVIPYPSEILDDKLISVGVGEVFYRSTVKKRPEASVWVSFCRSIIS